MTDENLEKIGAMVDYYFSDIMFNHDDHEVQIERTPNGLEIVVLMDYANPEDYYVDFGVNHNVDFEIKVEDGFLKMLDEICTVAEEVEAGAGRSRIIDAIVACVNEINAMADGDTPKESSSIANESPDDILFAPIKIEEKKKEKEPEQSYDDCCYYDG
jgi:hypothetical protein